jgi:hypothetical protein
LDYIGVKPEAAPVDGQAVLSWSANLLTINHRRAIAVCNNSSRYGFVLYGIKAKDIKNLGVLILEGVRACLEEECIDSEIIEAYLVDCGSPVSFTKTPSRSVVALLNQLCFQVDYKSELMNTDEFLQRHLLRRLNDDFVPVKQGAKRNHVSVYRKLAEDLSSRYRKHPYRCEAAEFEVELELESVCRRRIIVPLGYSFRQFHHILQNLFCWQDYHLHDFYIERYPNGRLKYTLVGSPREYELEGETTQSDTDVLLSEIFPRYSHIIYNYDFGDDWNHHIHFVRIINDYDKNHAECLSGEGDAPPEDVGGPGGYAHLLCVLADPEDPEHDDLHRWYKGMRCEPFDLEKINRRLRYWVRMYV